MLYKLKKYYKSLNIANETWLYVLFVIIAVFTIVWAINYYSNLRKPISPAINAVPPEPAFLLNFNDAVKLFAKISYENNICKEIFEIDGVKNFYKELDFLNSVFSTDAYAKNLIKKQTFYIAAYNKKNYEIDLLYLLSLADNNQTSQIKKFLSKLTGSLSHNKSVVAEKLYIYDIDFQTYNKKLYWSDYKGVFIASFDSALVIKSIKQIDSSKPLSLDKNFSKVYYTVGKKVDANIFINYKKFVEIYSKFISEKYRKRILSLQNFASWSGLDFFIKNQSFTLNGFTTASDTTLFLNIFADQPAPQMRLTSFAPYNTSVLLYFGINNFSSLFPLLQNFYILNDLQSTYYNEVIQKCNNAGIDIENAIINIIGNEYALVSNATDNRNNSDNFFAIINVSDSIATRELLKSLSEVFPDKTSIYDTINTNYFCGCIDLPPLAPAFLGNVFSPIKSNCFILYKDFLIIGNSINSLKKEIAFIETGKTLASNKNFTNFSDNITNETNVFLYCNIRKSIGFIENYLNNKLKQNFKENYRILRNFEALAIQFTKKDNLFYTGICLKHNPAYIDESPALWEIILDTSVASKPYVFYDDVGNINNILIFDISNNLYMLNKLGEIIWKIEIPEKIISRIYQVNINKNEERFFVFNSENKIYILNNLGEIHKGYPVKLPSPASSGMSVFDYDNKYEYRFIIPLKDKRIINLTYKASRVQGWSIPILDSPSEDEVVHYRIAGNDILVISSSKGTVYIINRRGRVIFNSINKFKLLKNTKIFLDKNNLVFAATNGKIYSIDEQRKLKSQNINSYSLYANFVLFDITNNGKKDYIFTDKGELKIFNNSAKLLYHYHEKPKLGREIFIAGNKTKPVLIIFDKENNIRLFNYKGQIKSEFPIGGYANFTTEIISNDNSINFITCIDNTVLYYYLIGID